MMLPTLLGRSASTDRILSSARHQSRQQQWTEHRARSDGALRVSGLQEMIQEEGSESLHAPVNSGELQESAPPPSPSTSSANNAIRQAPSGSAPKSRDAATRLSAITVGPGEIGELSESPLVMTTKKIQENTPPEISLDGTSPKLLRHASLGTTASNSSGATTRPGAFAVGPSEMHELPPSLVTTTTSRPGPDSNGLLSRNVQRSPFEEDSAKTEAEMLRATSAISRITKGRTPDGSEDSLQGTTGGGDRCLSAYERKRRMMDRTEVMTPSTPSQGIGETQQRNLSDGSSQRNLGAYERKQCKIGQTGPMESLELGDRVNPNTLGSLSLTSSSSSKMSDKGHSSVERGESNIFSSGQGSLLGPSHEGDDDEMVEPDWDNEPSSNENNDGMLEPNWDDQDAAVDITPTFEGNNVNNHEPPPPGWPGAYHAPGRAFGDIPRWARAISTRFRRRLSSTNIDATSMVGVDNESQQVPVAAEVVDEYDANRRDDAAYEAEIRNRVMDEAVQADVVDTKGRNRTLWIISCGLLVAVVIIVALVAGILLSRRIKNSSIRSNVTPTAGPSTTIVPTMTVAMIPSTTPSAIPTLAPSKIGLDQCSKFRLDDDRDLIEGDYTNYTTEYRKIADFANNTLGIASENVDDICSDQNLALWWLAASAERGNAFDVENVVENANMLVLVTMFLSLGGPGWRNNTNWLTNTSYCDWNGITCDGFGFVTVIFLDRNDVQGALPSEIGLLTALEYIHLTGNLIFGTIPSEIGRLTQLDMLRLDFNQFTGTIPSTIGKLSRLFRLWLGLNSLSGSIPAEIGNLTRLFDLGLDSNSLTGEIPKSIGRLEFLENLQLQYNRLRGTIPSAFGDLQSLEEVDLTANQLSGVPNEIAQLSRLQRLYLDFNPLNQTIPVNIGNLTRLEIFWCYKCMLHGTLPEGMTRLRRLESLDLESNQLEGTLPENLFGDKDSQRESDLQELRLSNNLFSGGIPRSLAGASELEVLDLSNNRLNGSIPASQMSSRGNQGPGSNQMFPPNRDQAHTLPGYNGLSRLRALYLQNNELSGEIPRAIGSLRLLETLWLDNNFIRGPIPTEIGGMESLQFFWAFDNFLTSSIPSEVGQLDMLVDFGVESNQLTGTLPPALSNAFTLESLWLSSNLFIGAIPSEFGSLSRLIHLNLYGIASLGGTIPAELGNLSRLLVLNVSGTNIMGSVPRGFCDRLIPITIGVDCDQNITLCGHDPCFG